MENNLTIFVHYKGMDKVFAKKVIVGVDTTE